MKKRKLNSTNPKYYPIKKEEVKERKELIATICKGRKRNIHVYAVFSERVQRGDGDDETRGGFQLTRAGRPDRGYQVSRGKQTMAFPFLGKGSDPA